MTGPFLHPRYNLECTFVRRCIPAAMSNSIPNQVEAGSTGSTMAGPVSVANSNPETAAGDQAVRATPLAEALKTCLPSPLRQYRGAESMGRFSNATDELAALLNTAGVYDLGWRRFIRCTGEDRVRWLNGMVTNFVGNLDENAGCYAFVLNAQGRIQGDLDIYRRADSLWLETDASQVEALSAFLDHYIIMDDVTLESQPQWTALGIAGPRAAATMAEAGLPVPSSPLHMSETTWQGHPVIVIAAYSPLVPRYEIWMERESVLAMWNALQAAGACLVASMRSSHCASSKEPRPTPSTSPPRICRRKPIRCAPFISTRAAISGRKLSSAFIPEAMCIEHSPDLFLRMAGQHPERAARRRQAGWRDHQHRSRRAARRWRKDRCTGNIRREALERKSDLMAGETVARPSPLPFDFSSESDQPKEFMP